MKIYKQVEIPQRDKQEIESLIEELESIQTKFKLTIDDWGIEFLEGTEFSTEYQKLNREITSFKQEYEDLQTTMIEYELNRISEDEIEDANAKLQQLRRRMAAIRDGE